MGVKNLAKKTSINSSVLNEEIFPAKPEKWFVYNFVCHVLEPNLIG